MPNIAAVLKEEICRLAKKEVKLQVGKTLHLGTFRLHTDSHVLLRLPNGQDRTPEPTVARVN